MPLALNCESAVISITAKIASFLFPVGGSHITGLHIVRDKALWGRRPCCHREQHGLRWQGRILTSVFGGNMASGTQPEHRPRTSTWPPDAVQPTDINRHLHSQRHDMPSLVTWATDIDTGPSEGQAQYSGWHICWSRCR